MAVQPVSRRSTQSGFTLVELLVAMAVMALVMLLVSQGLRFATTARERMLARSDGLQELVLGRDLLQRQLSRAQLLAWGETGRKRIAFSGDAERVRFVNVAPDYQPGTAWQLWEFALEPTARGGRDLLVRHAPFDGMEAGFAPLEETRPRLLATIDAPVAFTFFGKVAADDRGRWLDRWVETQRLPAAIRLTGGGDAWPELVVRTVIDASGRCAAENNEETIGCGT
jgi:general secretion pathway protein J